MKKRILCILLICIMTFGSALSVLAETSQDVQKEKEKTQEALDALNERVDDSEGATVAASKPQFREMKMDLEKMMGFAYCTDEMLQDAAFLTGFFGLLSRQRKQPLPGR